MAWTNITAPSCSQRFTTEDLRRNCPEVADDFTQEEIDGWIRSSKDYFDVLNRDNLQGGRGRDGIGSAGNRMKSATVCPISTPWVLFSVFLFLLWNFWDYLTPLHLISVIVGSVWVALKLSYTLSRFVWRRTFVTEVQGDGKAVLITGCDSGFGHRLAKRLAHKGFLVFAGCLNSKSDGAEELSQLKNITVLQMDVTKQEQVDDAFLAVKEKLGTTVLWAVVANAGIGSSGLLEWITMETVTKMFDVNVFGVLRVIKRFLPLLRKSHGRVVTVASPPR
ncbi:hypothetical protein MTO96_004064 [Rhipicephalus appendiculatus]